MSKVEATKAYGAEVVLVPGVYDDAAREAERLTNENGYTFAHPFNDPYVIAGQGTIGLEILEQLPEVEQVVVPIGGGGLISGIAVATSPTSLIAERLSEINSESLSAYAPVSCGGIL